ncbi:MAG: hypothetical protein GXO92_05920 [FCB group bacterium]|nr:hypothetical protein [FCB group bacterium]
MLCFLFIACPEPPVNGRQDTTIYLEAGDISLTTIRLKISVEDTTNTWTFGLTRNDSVILEAEVAGADTAVKDTGLRPSTTYRYRAYRVIDSEYADSSAELTVTTMDTTSHDFTWIMDTLGTSGSYLNDVAIVDENNIWAVGYIVTDEPDTVFNRPYTVYGAAVWNGIEWTLKQLNGPGIITPTIHPRGVWAFSENDIWFASGSIYHWDGNITSMVWRRDLNSDETVEKIWGVSPTNLYFVGNEGTIVHYDGSEFTRLESGTDLPIRDIWGVYDEETGMSTILMVASNRFVNPQDKKVLLLQDGVLSFMNDEGLPTSLSGLWFDALDCWYIVGAGVFKYDPVHSRWIEDTTHPSYPYKTAIRGSGINNVFIVGAFGHVSHFNGSMWKHYYIKGLVPSFYGSYEAVAVTDDIFVSVGWAGGRAVVLRGYRN